MRFSLIHLSDTHLCIEPRRHNIISLLRRNLRDRIDTGFKQTQATGLLSFTRPASYAPHLLSAVAQFCLKHSDVNDGILVTGDISTTGMMTDLDVAQSFVAAPATAGFLSATGFPTLNSSTTHIRVVPGNHDRYVNSVGSPNCMNFFFKLGSNLPGNFHNDVGHWVLQKEQDYLALILADFCLQRRMDASDSALAVFGQGRVYEDVLTELKRRTLMLRNEYSFIAVVWIIHFAPFDCGHDLLLHGWAGLVDAAVALNVSATLCGHTHQASKHQMKGHVVYCAGTASCVDREHDSRIDFVHFDVDSETCSISRDNYSWSDTQHEFVWRDAD